MQLRILAALAGLVLLYPALRATGLFPVDSMIEVARSVNPDRADSLAYRFANEDQLIERLAERPWFGWGTWGRNRIYDTEDGEDLSATDGFWIITMGVQGVVGFLLAFGMLLVPVGVLAMRSSRIASPVDRALLTGTAAILVVNSIDLLPNGWLMPSTIFVAGGLAGTLASVLAAGSVGDRATARLIEEPRPPASRPDEPVPALGRSLRGGAKRRSM